MNPFEKETAVATALALEAGENVLSWYGRADSELKKGGEPVTAADREANEIIVSGLTGTFPNDGLLSEETGAETGWEDRKRRWCVDPLDGTKEFIAQNGEFSVMIGLAEDGVAVLGVLFMPAQSLIFWGGPRIGSYVRKAPDGPSRRLTVSDISDPRLMTLALSRRHRPASIETVARRLGVTREVRRGSVGIKLGMVASCEADLYIHSASGTRLWDACAPDAVVRGAGGILTDCRGRPIPYQSADVVNRSGLVASNGKCHEKIIRALEPTVIEEGL